MESYLLLAVAAFVAGGMNAIAGGGSFLTFPALVLAGVPSIVANASSTVALFPASFSAAWAYRHHLRDFEGVSIRRMLAISFVGGAAGALLLLSTEQRLFDAIVPWLLLIASVAFTFGPRIAPYLRRVAHIKTGPLMVIQLVLAVYGGYFGAAIGIMLLAAWSLLGRDDIHGMNAAKNMLVGSMNFVATLIFIAAGKVSWPETMVMLGGAVAGAYGAARLSGHMKPAWIRAFIIIASFCITIGFFYVAYGPQGVS